MNYGSEKLRFGKDSLTHIQIPESFRASTTMEYSEALEIKLDVNHGTSFENAHYMYCEAIGSLMYMRIKINTFFEFAVDIAQFYESPRSAHWNDAKHVMQYVTRPKDFGICFSGSRPLDVCNFSDSDWAEDAKHLKSAC